LPKLVRKKARNTSLCGFLDQKEAEMISRIRPITLAVLVTAAIMVAAFVNASSALAQHGAAPPPVATDTPEQKMQKRFPQPVRIGDLIGLPVLDDDDSTIGRVRAVVRTTDGKVKLIVSYGGWFGFGARPVAVPIEVVAILARQINSVDMQPREYAVAPTWPGTGAQVLANDEMIRIALGRR
jgi:PRC-barrel domain protein